MPNKRIELESINRTIETNLQRPKNEWEPLPSEFDWIALVVWQGIRDSKQLEKYGVFDRQPVIDHFYRLLQKMVLIYNSK